MSKIYATLGRKFSKKDLEEAQRMGEDLVSYDSEPLLYNIIIVIIVLVIFSCACLP